ncbi:hypothetical protein PTKIN_Ptkin10aG0048800 [Pterospermum kingtungense]
MFSSALAPAFHIPINIFLAKAKGLEGVSVAIWISDLIATILLVLRLPNAKRAVGAIAIVLNFDYLLYSVMLSLSTCASTRIFNEIGVN